MKTERGGGRESSIMYLEVVLSLTFGIGHPCAATLTGRRLIGRSGGE